MSKVIPFFLFCIGLSLIIKKSTKLQFSTMIAIFLWYEIETFCFVKPYKEFTLLLAAILMTVTFIIPQNKIGKALSIIYSIGLIFLAIYLGCLLNYFTNFGEFGYEQLLGIMQTNFKELFENTTSFLDWKAFLYSIVIIFIIFIPFLFPKKYINLIDKLFNKYVLIKYALLLFLIIPILFLIKQDTLIITHRLYDLFLLNKNYKETLNNRIKPQLKFSNIAKDMNIILVIGESATKSHMSAYGYYRNTTPWLNQEIQKGNIILFENAFSCHSHTDLTIPYILSELNQTNLGNLSNSTTIINKLASKGYETWWISNQEKQGIYTTNFTQFALEAQNIYFSRSTELNQTQYDTILLPHIKNAINKKNTQQNNTGKFIIIHLQGSHGAYHHRYPNSFTPHLENYGTNYWGNSDIEKLSRINAYDHSIAYTDYFLSELIKNIPNNQKTILIYLSDHGESTIIPYYHDSSHELHYNIFAIPLFIWSTNTFKNEYPNILETLQNISHRYITNDKIYDLISFIESGQGDLNHITHNTKHETLIRYGQYSVDNLTWYETEKKIKRLKKITNKNILLHRVNSLEKLRIAEHCGFDGIEIDLIFDETQKKLFIGHDEINNKLSLEKFLQQMKNWQYKKIWLDIKNVNKKNAKNILYYLEKINNIYQFKKKCIVETSSLENIYSLFKDNDWFISYYIPTQNKEKINQLCDNIGIIKDNYKPSGLSFDLETYDLTQKICPKIYNNIPINTWILINDINEKNTITSHLFTHSIFMHHLLDSIIIPMPTEADI